MFIGWIVEYSHIGEARYMYNEIFIIFKTNYIFKVTIHTLY